MPRDTLFCYQHIIVRLGDICGHHIKSIVKKMCPAPVLKTYIILKDDGCRGTFVPEFDKIIVKLFKRINLYRILVKIKVISTTMIYVEIFAEVTHIIW